jgi:hypothetical protein
MAEDLGGCEAVQPGGGTRGEFVNGGIGAVGGDHGFEPAPQILTGIPSSGDRTGSQPRAIPAGLGRLAHQSRVMRRGVVPDQQLGHLGSAGTRGGHAGRGIRTAPTLASHAHQFAGGDIQPSVQHPTRVAAADGHLGLAATWRPGGPRGRELSQAGLITDPTPPRPGSGWPALAPRRAPSCRVLRVGSAEHVFGSFPAPPRPVSRPSDGPLAHRGAGCHQFGPRQRHRPASSVLPRCLRMGRQQFAQPCFPVASQAARQSAPMWRLLHTRQTVASPTRQPGEDARAGASQPCRDCFGRLAGCQPQQRLVPPPGSHPPFLRRPCHKLSPFGVRRSRPHHLPPPATLPGPTSAVYLLW